MKTILIISLIFLFSQVNTQACTNDADEAIWNNGADFQSQLQKCALGCFGRGECTGKCMSDDYGYSTDCGTCFGNLAGCTGSKCPQCIFSQSSDSCLNCLESNCTPDFLSCSGLTPPSEELQATATDACTNDADEAIWNNGADFQSQLQGCAIGCFGRGECTGKCMSDKYGYSSDCGGCFGNLAGCTGSKCPQCIFSQSSDSCLNCLESNCTPDFLSCSGLTPPSEELKATATDACLDDADQAIWNNGADFQSQLQKCALGCFGRGACTGKCMSDDYGYSTDCGGCFGDLAGCTGSSCPQCIFSQSSDSCLNCLETNCTPNFLSCSGLTPPSEETNFLA